MSIDTVCQQEAATSTNTPLVLVGSALYTSEIVFQETDDLRNELLLVSKRQGVIGIRNGDEFCVRESFENRRIVFFLDEHRLATGNLENRPFVGGKWVAETTMILLPALRDLVEIEPVQLKGRFR